MRSQSSIKSLHILTMAISVKIIAEGHAVDIIQAAEIPEVAIAFTTKGVKSVFIILIFI